MVRKNPSPDRSGRPRRKPGRFKAKPLEGNPFVALLAEVKADVDTRLDALLVRHLEERAKFGLEVKQTLDAARSLSSRGKRLRAALVVVGQKAFERGRPARWEIALECGVAVEVLQSYLLIHDDWMDQDDTRRGGPAVHAALRRRFRSEHKGAAAAVLAGDYLAALATQHLARVTRRHKMLPQLVECFCEMQLAAITGQQLDIIGKTHDAERVYKLKTSSYTVTGPLQLGALLAGATGATLTRLAAFADPLGVAFQLRDDLLGAFGEPRVTGKPRGSDLVQGKWTWIVEHALRSGRPQHRRALRAVLGNSSASPEQLAAATAALVDSGARAACEERIAILRGHSERALQRLGLTPRGSELLTGAVSALTDRRS
jgi:geranylgeranyl diphosphate synthase type I